MQWEQLLCRHRRRMTGTSQNGSMDLRSEFEKDYHRIIESASFRRLQDKTQVFPLDKSDFIRTRLTHSLEVSSFGKSLGQNIGEKILEEGKDPAFTGRMKEEISSILQCAGLIHDIGNPPFGHFGEEAIREWFSKHLAVIMVKGRPLAEILTPQMREDFYHFEGNAQALRLITRLHYLVDENGMNLTYALLNTIIKYPGSSLEMQPDSCDVKKRKIGYYLADEEIFREVTTATGARKNRHPLTYILEAADDLAYLTADIEDAFIKGFISYHQMKKELERLEASEPANSFLPAGMLEHYYQRGLEKAAGNPEEYAVKNWIVRLQSFFIQRATEGFLEHYDAIMEGSYCEDLFYGTAAEPLLDLLGDMAYRYVFSSEAIYKMEAAESVILNFLLDRFVNAIIYYDTEYTLRPMDKRMVSFISDNYKKAYQLQAGGKNETEKLYLRLLLVTDYICGMTDSYAKRLYQELNAMME